MAGDDSTTDVVLIVEDDRDLADYFTEVLATDYTVRTAYDGFEGLVRYEPAVDVVLLDRNLPVLQGQTVLEHIREHGHPCRVVMVTGVTPEIDILEMGIDDYLEKPVTKDQLQETVEIMLSLSSYDQELATLYTLSNKLAALRQAHPVEELEQDESYRTLLDRIDRQSAQVDRVYEEMDDQSFDVLLRS